MMVFSDIGLRTTFVMKTAKELSKEEKADDTVWPAFTSSLNFPASTKGGARVRYSAAGITCGVIAGESPGCLN